MTLLNPASARTSALHVVFILRGAAVVTTWITLQITRPLRRLGRAAQALAAGDLRHRVQLTQSDEVGDLGRSFDRMASALAERNTQLERALAERDRQVQVRQELAVTLARVGAAPSLDDALEALLRGALTLLRGDSGTVHLFHPQTGARLRRLSIDTDGSVQRSAESAPILPGTFTAALVAGSASILVPDNWALDPAAYALYESMRRRGLRASVNVPIDAGTHRLGSLHVNHREAGAFGQDDLVIVEALAAQAAATIERSIADMARQEAVAAREATLRQLTVQTEELGRRNAEAAALRELDRLKTEFLRTVSHELRTPLSLIYGFAELLNARGEAIDAATQRRMIERVYDGSRQLANLVDDLLDFSRIERGEVLVHVAELDLAPALREAVESFQRTHEAGRVMCELPALLPVRADRARVTQVVAHLLENALQYAPGSPVTVRARLVAKRASTPWPDCKVRVEVVDDGPGISPDEQARVWEKFYRGASVAGLNVVPGSGIGLAMVKALVEAQGGEVGLESSPARGACFWFELPAAADR